MNQKRAPAWGVVSLGSVREIPVQMHVSFLLLGCFFFVLMQNQGVGIALLYVVLGGISLTAHELGHGLAARKLGYNVALVLRAFNSAPLVQERVRPNHVASIALAGPAATVLIALLFWGMVLLGHGAVVVAMGQRLLYFNLILLGISLLPALPQDAGRALYSTLSQQRGERAATELVGRIGLAATAILTLIAIWIRLPLLGLLSVLLMTSTIFAVRSEMAKNAVVGERVEGAMLRQFKQLAPGDTLGEVAREMVGAGQHDFPVVQGDEVLGILHGSFLMQGLTKKQRAAYVAGQMDRNIVWAESDEPVSEILQRVRAGQKLPILVRQKGKLVGMLTAQSLQEFTTMKMLEETGDASTR